MIKLFYYKNLINYFLLSYLITWIIWAPLYLPYFGYNGFPILLYHHAYGALGPILAAFIMEKQEHGTEGVLSLLKRMVQWRVGAVWYVVVLAPLMLLIITMFWEYLAHQKPMDWAGIGVSSEFPEFSIVGFFLFNLVTFGIGEEVGWRGYALPRLQSHYSALKSTVLLTLGWAIWHIPAFLYRPGYVSMGFGDIIGWFLSLLTGAIILTWLFNSTKGSVFMCILFHTVINTAFTSDVALDKTIVLYLGIFITIWGVVIIAIARPLHLSLLKRVKTKSV